ncbi:MAG TPA: AIR synthase related protein [Oligoflexia bacterium]|nr:AIR synthase related protein [Oligoflexia bacterium]HMP48421.1 AIR synthase related protein [Oligoflexia bacterium]
MAIKLRRGMLYPPVSMEEGLQLGLDEIEWEKIIERLGRAPNHFECSIFAALWSDRVSFKNSSALIEASNFEYGSLIDLPGSTLKLLKIDDNNLLALRISQENALSTIEPYYAAQNALDSSLQELTAAGATPVAVFPMARFGNHELLKNQNSFKKLVHGLSSFANRFGIPVLGGDFYFHSSYDKSPMINCAVLGIISTSGSGDKNKLPLQSPVLYVGSSTGLERDIKAAKETTHKKSSAIPMGDHLLSSRIIQACREAIESRTVDEVVVVGPGGIAVASFHMAMRIGRPIQIDIDRIPTRSEISNSLDILLSETSDRVLMITRPDKHRALNQILYKWDLASTRVGEVNDADGIEFFQNHYLAADIPFHFAVSGAVQKTVEVVKFPPMLKRSERAVHGETQKKKVKKEQDEWALIREASLKGSAAGREERHIKCPSNLEDVWLDLLANPNLASKNAIFSSFDTQIGGRSLSKSGSDCGVFRLELRKIKDGSARGLASSVASNSLYVSMEPYLGTVQTVAEAMRSISSVGATPVALSVCLNFGSPDRYREVCDLAESIRGLGDASRIWDLPIMSKEVSLGNGTEGCPTMPTPVVIALGLIPDVRRQCSSIFMNKGDKVFLLGETKNEIGCSEYSSYVHKTVNTLVPDIDFELEKKRALDIVELIQRGMLSSCQDLSRGGLAMAITQSCLGGERPIGINLEFNQLIVPGENNTPLRPDSVLFSESSARYLVSFSPDKEQEIRLLCKERLIPITAEGEVGGKSIVLTGPAKIELPLSTTYKLWIHRLESYLAGDRNKTLLQGGNAAIRA